MQKKIIVTGDKSKTLLIPELNETYHSTKGAIQEAQHVFIKEGLNFTDQKEINLLEMGFGTGLNALLSLNESNATSKKIFYTTIEAFPISFELAHQMEYIKSLDFKHLNNPYREMHECQVENWLKISPYFEFYKIELSLCDCNLPISHFDLVFYDAFGPKIQPDLWTTEALEIISKSMKTGGILVTYCAQGQFKRNLKTLGFDVDSIPGPPGKREMTRATKR